MMHSVSKKKHVSPEALDASLVPKQRKPIPHTFKETSSSRSVIEWLRQPIDKHQGRMNALYELVWVPL